MEILFLIIIGLIWLGVASVCDIRKREIPNWISFSLIIIALSYRIFYSVFVSDARFFIYGLMGLAIFYIIAEIFYYSRVFGGGDARLLMALGSVLCFSSNLSINLGILGVFIFLLLVSGSVYGIFYSLFLVFLHKKEFSLELKKQIKGKKKLFISSIIFAVFSFALVLLLNEKLFYVFPFIFLLSPLLYIYAKAVEESCMIAVISSKKVTVGDWLYEEVSVGKKKIRPYWEGLSEKDVEILKRTNRKIKIKQGIAFVPGFFFAFLLLVYLWYSSWGVFKLFLFF